MVATLRDDPFEVHGAHRAEDGGAVSALKMLREPDAVATLSQEPRQRRGERKSPDYLVGLASPARFTVGPPRGGPAGRGADVGTARPGGGREHIPTRPPSLSAFVLPRSRLTSRIG